MLAIDTGPLVALFDKEDDKYPVCLAAFKAIRQPLITTWPVLTETFHLLGYSSSVQDNLWEFIERGVVAVHEFDRELMMRCRALMKQYRDLPMDFADASLVAVAERLNILAVFTLDKDFMVYRTRHKKHFKILPAMKRWKSSC